MREIVVEAINRNKKGWRGDLLKKLKHEYPEMYRQLIFLEEQINSKLIEGATESELKPLIKRWEKLIEEIKGKI